jgi:hypothetical protein
MPEIPRAVFLSDARVDAAAARFARTLNIQRSTLNVQMTNATRRRRRTTG